MERDDSAVTERPTGTVKHPVVAMALASGRILIYSLRHGGKPLRVNYRTGDVQVDGDSATG